MNTRSAEQHATSHVYKHTDGFHTFFVAVNNAPFNRDTCYPKFVCVFLSCSLYSAENQWLVFPLYRVQSSFCRGEGAERTGCVCLTVQASARSSTFVVAASKRGVYAAQIVA